MSKDSEKEIIEQLKRLPKVADETDKEKLYQHVSSRLNKEEAPIQKDKNKGFIPLLTAAAVLILVIPFPFLLINMGDQTVNDSTAGNTAYEEEATLFESEDNAEITSYSLEEVQKSDITSTIQKTISEDITFELELDSEVLIFHFIANKAQSETEISDEMIESILLIAKGYDFQYVLFENIPVIESEVYDFTEPIEVPLE